jgi:hypothetical protein
MDRVFSCSECGGNEILVARRIADFSAGAWFGLAAAHEPASDPAYAAVSDEGHRTPGQAATITGRAYGFFQAYVCRNCGFTKLFADDPGAIPIGPRFGTALVGSPFVGPYR